MLSSHNALPRQGHLEAVFNVSAYLKRHPLADIVFDDELPHVQESRFKKVDWKTVYGDVEETLPPNMPEPMGKTVEIHCFVDADHAGNLATRRSHTGILVFLFLNKSPTVWYSKQQNLWH
jgi:hypothetical protein